MVNDWWIFSGGGFAFGGAGNAGSNFESKSAKPKSELSECSCFKLLVRERLEAPVGTRTIGPANCVTSLLLLLNQENKGSGKLEVRPVGSANFLCVAFLSGRCRFLFACMTMLAVLACKWGTAKCHPFSPWRPGEFPSSLGRGLANFNVAPWPGEFLDRSTAGPCLPRSDGPANFSLGQASANFPF